MQEEAINLLKSHNIRKTAGRIDVIAQFIDKNYAHSHKDIEAVLANKYDRVTLYRILSGFEEAGLIHRVFDGENTIKYALCQSECHGSEHKDQHIHFQCNDCDKTYCIEFNIPTLKLPQGYRMDDLNILAKGQCPQCGLNENV